MVLFVDNKVTKLEIIMHYYTFYQNNTISYTFKCDDENIQFYHSNNVYSFNGKTITNLNYLNYKCLIILCRNKN